MALLENTLDLFQDVDWCIALGRWSSITAGKVDKATVTSQTLWDMSRIGHADVIRSIVVQYKIDVNSSDKYGWTALHIATLHNHLEAVFTLLDLGALDQPTNDGICPSNLRPELFGFPPDAMRVPITLKSTATQLMIQITKKKYVCHQTLAAHVLHAADQYGKDLFMLHNEFNRRDPVKKYLMSVVRASTNPGWTWLCRICLELGVNVNDPSIFVGETLLHRACRLGNEECTELLLDYGADVNAYAYPYYECPMHMAVQADAIGCIQLLLEAGADINQQGGFGNSPLHNACFYRNPNAIRFLMDQGADVNAQDHNGLTPFVPWINESF